ncbi:MAG: MmgE/PrpD family protein [Chloroflexota bacterium]
MRQDTAIQELAALVADRATHAVPADVRRVSDAVVLDVLTSYLAADPAVEIRVSPDAALLDGAAATAFRVAATAHSLDLDETHFGSSVHAASAVIGVLLGLSNVGRQALEGDELRDAVAVSLEIAARVGLGAPGVAQRRGYTTTAVFAPLASAAVACCFLGLDVPQTAHALALATDGAGGTRGGHLDGGADTKFIHMGRSAAWGVTCAALAAQGVIGASDPLFGRFGLFRTVLGVPPDDVDRAAVLDGIGTTWAVRNIGFKAFPTHLGTQACADALLTLLDRQDRRQVADVTCKVHPHVIPTVAEPRSSKLHPVSGYAARFSLPIVAALCVVDGELHAGSFSDRSIRRAAVLDVAARVRVLADPAAPAPGDYPGRVDIRFEDGSVLTSPWQPAPGVPARPLSDVDLEEKFRAWVEPRCGGAMADLVLAEVRGPARGRHLMKLTTSARGIGAAPPAR